MSKYSTLFALALASLSLAACGQTICQDGESGTCGEVQNSDGGGGTGELTCDDPNLTSCDSRCVDTDISPDYCGSCENSCGEGQGCSAGECVDFCEAGELNCGGTCIDPLTDADFCGASGTCTGTNAGIDSGDDQCSVGACLTQRYLGSLTPTTGLWNYGGTIGVPGAVTACQTLFSEPTAKVCSHTELVEAQNNGELVNALDSDGAPVAQWWVLDANENVARQCTNTDVGAGGANVPWSYQTAHIGQGAKFITLSASAGTVSGVIDATPASDTACNVTRNVPCCLP